MTDGKKYVYEVVCCNNPDHVFTMVSAFPRDTGDGGRTDETYCAQCDAFVRVTVQRALKKSSTMPSGLSSTR
jgi:hypothetical protein